MKYKLLPRLLTFFFILILLGAIFQVLGLKSMIDRSKLTDEQIFLRDQESIVTNVLQKEFDDIRLLVADFAEWDDLYNGIVEYDYEWSYENATRYLTEDAVYGVDFVNVIGQNNNYYEYHGYGDAEDSQALIEFQKYLKDSNTLMSDYIDIDGELFIVAGAPITRVDGRDVIGHYIIGRGLTDTYLNNQFLTYLVMGEYIGLNGVFQENISGKLLDTAIELKQELKNKDGKVMKELRLSFSLLRYYKNYDSLFVYTVVITVLVACIIFVSLLQAAKKLNFIVQETIVGVDRIAKGDYSHRIHETKNHELNQVIDHVNHMGAQIEDKIKRIQQNHLETLALLVNAVEEKDFYTRGHSERVKDISLLLAQNIGYEELDLIEEAALLHDIGKIGIHEDVLNKPGRLTDEEYDIIKEHPVKGERILSSSTKLAVVASIVRQHHEHYDGRGYPDGLKGASIEIEARIIAVADAFDAMTSKRPYRQAKTFENALDILIHEKGTQFDPKVVEAFVDCQDDVKKIMY